MKKLFAIMLALALCLTGFAMAESTVEEKFHTQIEEGSFIIQVDSKGDLAWVADDMAQDSSVVKLYDADTLDDTFVVRYDPVGDGDVTVGVRHYSGIACDEMMTYDLHVEGGAVQSVTGGSYAVANQDEAMDQALVGTWHEKDNQFATMTIEKNPARGYDIEIVSPVSHGAYVFKTSVLLDCELNSFVYGKGKFWDIDGNYGEGAELGEARTAGTTGSLTPSGDSENPVLEWHDDDENPETSIVFVRG